MRSAFTHVRFALLLGVVLASPAVSQPTCASVSAASQAIERGWTAYRGNDMTAAGNDDPGKSART